MARDGIFLRNAYENDKKTSNEIAEMLGNVSAKTIREYLRKNNIHIRSISEALLGKFSGKKHPNWQGGITELDDKLRRFFHEQISPIIWKRDNYTCQCCGSHNNLHAHHIKYFSEIVHEICNEHPELNVSEYEDKCKLYDIIINDMRFLDLNNLITLCKKCHL